jgi:hypothetical protein
MDTQKLVDLIGRIQSGQINTDDALQRLKN